MNSSEESGCVFCGRSPVSTEHVFSSKWLENLMPNATTLTTHFSRSSETGYDRKTYQQTPKKRAAVWRGGPTINCACKKCNETWMQEMDEGVKEVLTPLALGEIGTVEREGVRRLSIWATKIAFVLDSARTPTTLAAAIKHEFRKKPAPLKGSTISVGAMSPADDSVRVNAGEFGPTPGVYDGKGYVATFRVIHLVAQVVYPPPGMLVRRGPEFPRDLMLLWPGSEKLRWPPPEESWLTSEDEFQSLATAFQSRPL